MTLRSKRRSIWLMASALVVLIAIPLWGPMRTAWRCYQMHQNGIHERAEVLKKLPDAIFALQIVDGPHAGEVCTADASAAIYDATKEGGSVEIVYAEWKPGECELVSTISASGRLLWLLTAVIASMLAGIAALAVALSRSFTRPAHPKRLMRVERTAVRCHACGELMEEGYLPLLSGIHWRMPGEPVGLPHALKGLPGTVGWRGRPRVHAFRCAACEIVSFQYGKPSDVEANLP